MFFNFEIGDFLFHPKYGIGKFISFEYIEFNNSGFDFIKLQYLNDSFIFIPSYHSSILKFHSSKNVETKIDVLGKSKIFKKESKLKEEIEKIAKELMEIAALRETIQVDPLFINNDYIKFSENVSFTLTNSQEKAIQDLLKDLQKTKPMDRLLCGDVGFGKTEVALRGVALALFNNKKAIFIVPTTILANQHFKNFQERFKGFDKKCAMLSKLSENSEEIKKAWKNNEIDLLVTTAHHKGIDNLLIDELGIVILDEEHHFGVKFKEKIRQKSHFLQLSATPIPRTLNLALSKVKDFSTLDFPPEGRKATSVFIKNLDEINLKDLIINNDGKIFLVVPRIEFIKEVEKMINFIPYTVVHGRMDKTELEQNLEKFMNQDIKILLATNIIESGLNIIEANLMIIFEAQMFGISQLHQLKGRIGRGNQQSQIYLIVPKSLKEISNNRLNMIEQNQNLGSGFNLAMQDMEQRGAGTLASHKQSGKDYGFGIEVYYDMLNNILKEKLENKKHEILEKINNITFINFNKAFISSDYISDLNLKILFYKKLSGVKLFQELTEIIKDLKRFGELPDELSNFLTIIKFNLLSKELPIKKVIKKNNAYEVHSDDKNIYYMKEEELDAELFKRSI